MTALLKRLRELRRQAGTRQVSSVEAEAPQTNTDDPGQIPDSLARWLQQRKRLQAQSGMLRAREMLQSPLPGFEIAPGVRLHEHHYAAVEPSAAFQIRFRPTGQFNSQNLLYFDTETTGLSGGTGTRAFMIGCADWYAGQLRVRQLLCTNLAGELAMLQQFCRWLSPETVLVSYNGRSFDVPLLKTRLRLARLSDSLSDLRHIDLIHPTRRLYRGRWLNCRLGTIENHVLNLVRDDDLPGSEAPQAWLNFLRAERTTELIKVIDHNTQDLRSLHALLWHLVRIDETAFELHLQ